MDPKMTNNPINVSGTTNKLIVTVSEKFGSNGSNKNGSVLLETSSGETADTCRFEYVTAMVSIKVLDVDPDSVIVSPFFNKIIAMH